MRDGAGYRGTVRISLPTSLGIRRIIPRLSSFVENHPDLIAAAVAGIGVTSTNAWACRREMDDELLVRLLPEWARRGHEGLDASTATGY